MSKTGELFKEIYDVNFTWSKPAKGFWLAPHPLYKELYSNTTKYLGEESREQVQYNPFDDNSIFANFADSEANDESFNQWANELGRLSHGECLDFETLDDALDPEEQLAWRNCNLPMEKLELWYATHRDLSDLFTGWQRLITQTVEDLGFYYEWEEFSNGTKHLLYYPKGKDYALQADQAAQADYMKRMRSNNAKRKALWQRNSGWLKYISSLSRLENSLEKEVSELQEKNRLHLQSYRRILFPSFREKAMNPMDNSRVMREGNGTLNQEEQIAHYYPDIIEPAKICIKNEIQKKLDEYGVLFHPHNVDMGKLSTGDKKYSEKKKRLKNSYEEKQKITVPDLRGALWLQFFFHVNQHILIKKCEVCGKWFYLGGKRHEDSNFCSNKCYKKKDHEETRATCTRKSNVKKRRNS